MKQSFSRTEISLQKLHGNYDDVCNRMQRHPRVSTQPIQGQSVNQKGRPRCCVELPTAQETFWPIKTRLRQLWDGQEMKTAILCKKGSRPKNIVNGLCIHVYPCNGDNGSE